MAEISFTKINDTSFQAYVSGLDTSYEKSDRYIEWYMDSSYPASTYYGSKDLAAFVSESDAITFTGLSSNTKYYVRCVIYYTTGSTLQGKGLEGDYTISSSSSGGNTGTTSSGSVHVCVNKSWHEAVPYVWVDGGWHKTTPYVWVDGKWRVYNG